MMFTQFAPVLSHRCHWYAYVIGAVPDQVPGAAVSICPSRAVPEIVGGATFSGGFPTTMPVAADDACAEPPAFDAVTVTRSVDPTSGDETVYVEDVAPTMSVHVPPEESHRRH